jgi:grpE
LDNKKQNIKHNRLDLEVQKKNKEIQELNTKIVNITGKLEEKEEIISNLNKAIDEAKNNTLRAQAELVNYRKRKDAEVSDLLKYANADFAKELIVVVDNFERAIKMSLESNSEELKKYMEGYNLTYTNLISILNKFGISEINRLGEKFDPNLEQALLTDHDESKDDDVVTEVLLKGYMLKDRVIRPASVKVNNL